MVPEGLGVGEASCLGIISMGICKAGPSCLKDDSLLTQVFFFCSKGFSHVIFSVILRAYNHQLIDQAGIRLNGGKA